ncbi:hypothetical protein EMPS_10977 [Entomortierella parvispora]|uniref:L-type lectin-like domain-containing protein n=1 Tax=Entomortierella parvispora TaxID=205924 RepID=A0A9P3HLN2_9FUNG|nr:hypothetical protein EMPS_10977 [Entomortierella parvispora]
MLFSKKRFMLGAAVALLSATTVFAQEDDDNLQPLRTHSLYMPYIDQDLQNRWFDFGGDALINTNRHVRLTQDMPSQSGWLWSRLPLEVSNFQIEFEFAVGGKGDNLFGDGFAVWLTKERAEPGPVFGSRDHFEGLGIFFDTYENGRSPHTFPYVLAMMGDGRTKYDNDNDGSNNKLGGCESNFRGRTETTKGRLTYSRDTSSLNLKIQTQFWDQWDDCFTLQDIKLPELPYLGFTAHTGEVHDNHDIVSVTTSTMVKAPQLLGHTRNTAPPPSSKSGLGWYLKFLAISGVFVGVVAVAYNMSKKSNDMKRF